MPIDFDAFLICVLALFGGFSFVVQRQRRHEYNSRLGSTVTALPIRTNRTMLLLGVLALVASGGVVLGIVHLLTEPGIQRLTGLMAIAGAVLFFLTSYRESTPLIGEHGFAIPYYNLFLPWSAIETITYTPTTRRTSLMMNVQYRSKEGSRSMLLRLPQHMHESVQRQIDDLRITSQDDIRTMNTVSGLSSTEAA